MKKILFIFIACILALTIVGCKNKKCKDGHTWVEATFAAPKTCLVCGKTEGKKIDTSVAKANIEKNVNTFDITVDLNGTSYRLIKSIKGYYLEDLSKNLSVYYNKEQNKSYKVNNKTKTITLVNGNYNFAEYVENIYFVLTYHLNSKTISGLSIKDDTYLNRTVSLYYSENPSVVERYYIDKETGACLNFVLDDGVTKIICKVDSFSLLDEKIDQYNTYDVLEYALNVKFEEKETILEQFNEYSLTIEINGELCRLIRNASGFFCSLVINDRLVNMLYDFNENLWYELNDDDSTRFVSETTSTVDGIEEIVFDLLTNHLENVDKTFFVRKNQTYNLHTVDMYERSTATDNIMYMEEYYIDVNSGICVYKNVNLSGYKSSFELKNISHEGDITKYLDYEIIRRPEKYDSWPVDHPYLEGIEEIKYGTFYLGYEDKDGLNLIYNNFNSTYVDYIIEKFEEYGFTIDANINKKEDDSFNYIYYIYQAKREDGYTISIDFDGNRNTLTIIINDSAA